MSHQHARSRQTSRTLAGSLLGVIVLVPACYDDARNWGSGRARAEDSDVNVVFDSDVDFSMYRTFAFRADADMDADAAESNLDRATRGDLALVNQRAAAELAQLGLTQVAPEQADLLVFSLGRTERGTGVSWSCVGGVWSGYWLWDHGYYYDPCAWREPSYQRIERTTLMIGLLDPELSQVTFAGFIRGVGADSGSRARQIARAVDRVFDRYPARPPARTGDGSTHGADAGIAAGDAGFVTDAGTSVADRGASDAGVTGDAGDAGDAATSSP